MGLFRTQTRRDSGEFRWPFKPLDHSAEAQRKRRNRASLKISNPVLIESTKDVSDLLDVSKSAPLEQGVWDPAPSTLAYTEKPQHFEPLFQDSYVSPIEEHIPFELSAASAARFHDYLQDLSSSDPSADNSEYDEEDEVEILDTHEGQATTVHLVSPGKPKMIDLSPASSYGSSRSVNSSSSDVRTSGFLHSRSVSDASDCDTPYTPLSFFDSSDDSTPSEELEKNLHGTRHSLVLKNTATPPSWSMVPKQWDDDGDAR